MARARWTPRTVQRLGQWSSGATPLKAYAILAKGGEPLDPALPAKAAELVAEAEAQLAATEQEGMGFVILHRSTEGVWLLLHWWVDGDACAQLLWHSPLDGPPAFTPLDRPSMACVWELALIDHERRAYVRSLSIPGDAVAAYLQDIFPQDFC